MHAKTYLITAMLGAFALSGCATGDGSNSGAQTGAILGALGGAAIGSTSKSHNKWVTSAVGGAIGAGIGGALGSTLDAQAADLRRDVNNPNIGIVNTGNELVVTLPEAITFATDSATVSIQTQRDISAVANNLLQYPNSTIVVTGHTDSTGTAAHNQDLSQRRAQSVANVLTANGVPAYRISTVGRASTQPIASNVTVEGRAQNRRVEITIRPNG